MPTFEPMVLFIKVKKVFFLAMFFPLYPLLLTLVAQVMLSESLAPK